MDISIYPKAKWLYGGIMILGPVMEHDCFQLRVGFKRKLDCRNGGSSKDEIGIPSNFYNNRRARPHGHVISNFQAKLRTVFSIVFQIILTWMQRA
jgi:hypothetical protein